jgi:hypothetical protein
LNGAAGQPSGAGTKYLFDHTTTIADIRNRTLDYFNSLRVMRDGVLMGYRHSAGTHHPVLYATVSVLLTKHLFGVTTGTEERELALLQEAQEDDGLFHDRVIACPLAETEDWWGWRHLTLHALMALALYGRAAKKEIVAVKPFLDENYFKKYLETRDWDERIDFTSNEVQNIGTMLQYARDYQGLAGADRAINLMLMYLAEKQDVGTGFYGAAIGSPCDLTKAIVTGYHFWLLYFYERKTPAAAERIIDNIIASQNVLGGFSHRWNSSACEDIDAIDPLVRLSCITGYRHFDVQNCLRGALRAVLTNLNGDGGWVFRRHEALTVVHAEMHSGTNESNIFYTWFRTLGLALVLQGLEKVPDQFVYPWRWGRAPGHQFWG